MSSFRFLGLATTLSIILFCEVGWGLPLPSKSDIQLMSVEAKYNAQRQILILKGELFIPTPWHVYAHKLDQEYYVETGFRLQDSNKGELVRSQFPKEETLEVLGEILKVHSGFLSFSQWFYLNLIDSKAQKANKALFPLEVRLQYQACSDEICLPPVLLPVVIREVKSPEGNKLQAKWNIS